MARMDNVKSAQAPTEASTRRGQNVDSLDRSENRPMRLTPSPSRLVSKPGSEETHSPVDTPPGRSATKSAVVNLKTTPLEPIRNQLKFLQGDRELAEFPRHLLVEIWRHLRKFRINKLSCARHMKVENDLYSNPGFVLAGSDEKVLTARFQWLLSDQSSEILVAKQKRGNDFMGGEAAILYNCGQKRGRRSKWYAWKHTYVNRIPPRNAQWVERLSRQEDPRLDDEQNLNGPGLQATKDSDLYWSSTWGPLNGGQCELAGVKKRPMEIIDTSRIDRVSPNHEENESDGESSILTGNNDHHGGCRRLRQRMDADTPSYIEIDTDVGSDTGSDSYITSDASTTDDNDNSSILRSDGSDTVVTEDDPHTITVRPRTPVTSNRSEPNQRSVSTINTALYDISDIESTSDQTYFRYTEPLFVFKYHSAGAQPRMKTLTQCNSIRKLFDDALAHSNATDRTTVLEIKIIGVNPECHGVVKNDEEDFKIVLTRMRQLGEKINIQAHVRALNYPKC